MRMNGLGGSGWKGRTSRKGEDEPEREDEPEWGERTVPSCYDCGNASNDQVKMSSEG